MSALGSTHESQGLVTISKHFTHSWQQDIICSYCELAGCITLYNDSMLSPQQTILYTLLNACILDVENDGFNSTIILFRIPRIFSKEMMQNIAYVCIRQRSS